MRFGTPLDRHERQQRRQTRGDHGLLCFWHGATNGHRLANARSKRRHRQVVFRPQPLTRLHLRNHTRGLPNWRRKNQLRDADQHASHVHGTTQTQHAQNPARTTTTQTHANAAKDLAQLGIRRGTRRLRAPLPTTTQQPNRRTVVHVRGRTTRNTMITTPIDFLAGITVALAVIVLACLMHRPPPPKP